MSNLTDTLPQNSLTVEAIYEAYKRRGDAEPSRGHLGASIIGHSCTRYLWYLFRQCCKPEFSGRMYRLFETGDLEEIRFTKDLRDIGCTVHEVDEHGNQFAVYAHGGHFSGHMDGAAVGIPEAPKTWHVLEYKTHNDKSFTKLKKEGVKKSKPQHYAQMQVYMHLTGMKRALYLARNKDTDEIYAERIRYDAAMAETLLMRAETVIRANEPPERITQRRDWWECQYCDAQGICWGSPLSAVPLPALSCRHCCHATPVIDDGSSARWKCEKHGRSLSQNDQDETCHDHLILPGLVKSAEPIDYGSDENGEYIRFSWRNDEEWVHGRGAGRYSSRDLMALPASLLSNPMVRTSSSLFNASEYRTKEDILDRYPEEDSEVIWKGEPNDLFDAWRTAFKEPITKAQPITRCKAFDHDAAEFEGGRVAILWHAMGNNLKQAEIRKGKE